jgi:Leucine-rich repeat (LRR) protein
MFEEFILRLAADYLDYAKVVELRLCAQFCTFKDYNYMWGMKLNLLLFHKKEEVPKFLRIDEFNASGKFNAKNKYFVECNKLTLPLATKYLWFIKELPALRQLYLVNTNVTSIDDLANLKLTKLDLKNTKVSNIDVVRTLTCLELLNLKNTQVRDISPVSELSLLYLNLDFCPVSDVSQLPSTLEMLGLACTKIKELPIDKLKNLTVLNLNNTTISSLQDLSSLSNLRGLHLSTANVDNIAFICNMQLAYLDLSANTSLTNLDGIQTFTSLETLKLSLTGINDVSLLQNLQSLTNLDISYCNIPDLTPLTTIQSLEILNVEGIETDDDLFDRLRFPRDIILGLVD